VAELHEVPPVAADEARLGQVFMNGGRRRRARARGSEHLAGGDDDDEAKTRKPTDFRGLSE